MQGVDARISLALQLDWGADEAIEPIPRDRLAHVPAPTRALPAPGPASPRVVGRSAADRAAGLAAAATTRDQLRAALAGFTDCLLQHTAMHLVFADGAAGSGLMLIGDTPGEEEDRTGRPFSGPGGLLLDRMLASIGLDRSQALLTTAIPWRPPGNRKPTDHERALCLPFLHRHIALVRPRRIVLLGTQAAAALIDAPAATLRRQRGQWQELAIPGLDYRIAALPSVSPEQLIATPAAKRDAWADLLTLRRALDQDAADPHPATQ